MLRSEHMAHTNIHASGHASGQIDPRLTEGILPSLRLLSSPPSLRLAGPLIALNMVTILFKLILG